MKKIIFGLIAVAIIVFLIFILNNINKKVVNDKKIYENALDTINLVDCDNISDEKLKNQCLEKVNESLIIFQAGALKDKEYCSNLEDKSKISFCQSEVEKNIKKFDDEILEKAKNDLNEYYCNDIFDDSKKVQCIDQVKLLVQKDINLFTGNLQDVSDCSLIKQQSLKEECENNLNISKTVKKSVEENDHGICDEIEVKEDKENCIIQFNHKLLNQIILSGSINDCSKLNLQTYANKCKDHFNNIKNIKFDEQNPKSICNSLKNKEDKNSCIQDFDNKEFYAQARSSMDVKLCEKISNEDIKIQCKENIADNKNFIKAVDEELQEYCQKINEETLKNECIEKIKSKIEFKEFNEEYCKSLKDEKEINSCMQRFKDRDILTQALESLDIGKCDSIVTIDIKNKCKKSVEKRKNNN